MTIKTAFITGTGFYELPGMQPGRVEQVATPFGEMEVEIAVFAGQEVAFIRRHGKQHTLAPSEINYRGNIYALKLLGVERILSTSVCGSLDVAYQPGSLALVDQFLDFTWGRAESFYPFAGRLAHVDVTDPYCKTIHRQLQSTAQIDGFHLHAGATYACFNGPRFENRAEIEMVRRLGGQLVGQTNYPECVLAREQAMCYATVGVVSNMAAGMQGSLTTQEVFETITRIGDRVARLFASWLQRYPAAPDCACRHALDGAFV